MLTRLFIQNVVLIEQIELAFEKGLCVLTGETGAGKTILLEALQLPLGSRAESRLLRQGANQASVVAEFNISDNKAAQAALAELSLEIEDVLILRRTLTADGKTRCFINDQPVSVAALKQLGDTLLEIHGQHDQRGLLNTATHLDVLDQYGALDKQRKKLEAAYTEWKTTEQALAALLQKLAQSRQELDYLQHVKRELEQLHPEPGEEEQLSKQRSGMMQSEKLAEVITNATNELQGQKSVQASLGTAERILTRSALNSDNKFVAAIEALQKAQTEVEEVQSALAKIGQDCAYSPEKLEQMEERLFALRAAGRKYNMPVEELPDFYAQISEKLALVAGEDAKEETLRRQVEKSREEYASIAQALSEARAKQAKKLEKAVMQELEPLKMAGVGFAVAMERLEESQWSAKGMDSVRFEAATNKGAAFAPLHRIASGGELSRFMLALKVVLAGIKTIPSLIFDEIDSGTGGAVADAIGERLAKLGKTHQIFVVTHLPQVAAKGQSHIRISKETVKGKTFTHAETLTGKTRTEELARMLAGAEITQEARKAAQRLMATA